MEKSRTLNMKKILTYAMYLFAALGFVALGYVMKPVNTEVVIEKTQEPSALTEWQIMELAIYKTESEFNPLAVGKTEDWGIAQITPIYVKEVNRILGEDRYIHEDAFNPQKSHEMLTIMQNYHNPSNDIDKAIASHNPTASSAYSVKVRRAMESIKQYEELRNLVKQ